MPDPGSTCRYIGIMQEIITNAMTVDVEDYFQVSAFENCIPRSSWEALPCRVQENTDYILDLFDEHGVHATFFVLGWVADRYPSLIRKIADSGHEVASHGYSHARVNQMSPDEFRNEVVTTKKLLEDLSGIEVIGFRAPSYSINQDNLWALEVLHEVGYRYSSSIYPVKHDLYGMPQAPRFPFRVNGDGILEIPITTLRILNHNYPGGGGGFFRLFPYPLSRKILQRVNRHDRHPGIFYFHPWEIDVDQPRQRHAPMRSRFRHYLNLGKMAPRVKRLMDDFSWGRMDAVYSRYLQGEPAAIYSTRG